MTKLPSTILGEYCREFVKYDLSVSERWDPWIDAESVRSRTTGIGTTTSHHRVSRRCSKKRILVDKVQYRHVFTRSVCTGINPD